MQDEQGEKGQEKEQEKGQEKGQEKEGEIVLEAVGLRKSFRGKEVLRGIDLKLLRGESKVLLGLGDSGKSVLLKIFLQIMPYDGGDIRLNGKSLKSQDKKALKAFRNASGMLFQNNALFDSLTVGENISFYLNNYTKASKEEIKQQVDEGLWRVGLGGNVSKMMPSDLSGGMRKRVGIARALMHKPKVLFLDEPTAGLDPIISESISQLIRSIKGKEGITVLTVTSDILSARRIGDRCAMLYDGVIYKEGEIEEVLDGGDKLMDQFIHGSKEGPIDISQVSGADA